MTRPDFHWYVVQTQAHAEIRAVANLARQGFETYLPRYLKRRHHARRVDVVPKPLFPRYLFVAVDMKTQRWRSIHSTVGVSRLVCRGDEPAVIANGVIAALQAREDERGYVQLERRVNFTPGDKVRVLDGMFASCLGLFEGVRDSERVAVMLEFLGRKVRVVLDDLSVAAA